MFKISTIIGARPQFVKASVVSRQFQLNKNFSETLVHTGQHFDQNLSEQFFLDLEIPAPKYNLNCGSGSHGVQTGKMLAEVEAVLLKEKPDWVLVYGDTNSTLAGALAAAKLNIPIAHVEAGLRSFNRKMPEEINRISTDHISTALFTPTKTASLQLEKEGISSDRIIYTGDVMYDASLHFSDIAERKSVILKSLKLLPREYILATIHRAENTDDPERLSTIFSALAELSKEIKVVLPLHPRTQKALVRFNLFKTFEKKIHFIEPVGFLDMILLEKNAKAVVTDSGGVQKEAYFYKVPCVTLRDETEWTELVDVGWNHLCPPISISGIIEAIRYSMGNVTRKDDQLYGDGNSAKKIVQYLTGL